MLGKKLIQAASGNAAAGGLGIEDIFSTWLYTGNGSTQTITNGIDLAGEGGMLWVKSRNDSYDNQLTDTARGSTWVIASNKSDAAAERVNGCTAFTASGFSLGSHVNYNESARPYTSWTFRKAPGFFDVVTWTGDGSDPGMRIPHSLGSAPGCIIVKKVNAAGSWYVFHRSTGDLGYTILDNTGSANTLPAGYGWDVTATDFRATAGLGLSLSGATFVAYLFAHDEQIFGEGGDQSVIKCGSYTGTNSNVLIDLGWEPQWLMVKRANATTGNASQDSWHIINNMTGITVTVNGNSPSVKANTSDAENVYGGWGSLDPRGFYTGADVLNSGQTFIYIAIRRGPMKTPTSGTEVFAQETLTPTTGQVFTTNFPVDASISNWKSDGVYIGMMHDRLRGYVKTNTTGSPILQTSEISAESTFSSFSPFIYAADSNTSVKYGGNSNGVAMMTYAFRRAPGFFDVVAYTGTGAARTVNHNLGVVPELMIVKRRNLTSQWSVYNLDVGANNNLILNSTSGVQTSSGFFPSNPTGQVFYLGSNPPVNEAAGTFIAYLFATLPGVSKCFNYTGTGTTLQIDCGFASGARLVLIKRTDSTGDWYIWDTARGITSSADPYLLLNSAAAEVTGTDYIDPYSAGFEISSSAPAAVNASGGSFIGLAIA